MDPPPVWVRCKIKVKKINRDGTQTRFEIPGLRLVDAKPVDSHPKTDEISLPAPSSDAIEIFEIVKKVIVDTGTRFNLASEDMASRAPISIVQVLAQDFNTANGHVWADTAMKVKISLMGNRC